MDFSHGPDVVEQVQPVPDGEDVEESPQHGVEDHGDYVGEKLAVVEGVGRIYLNSCEVSCHYYVA